MAGIIVSTGAQLMLQELVGVPVTTSKVRAHLYTNSHTPVVGDTPADYTEPTDGSYASVLLAYGTWVISATVLGGQAVYTGITFNFSAGATIEGYYLTDAGSTVLISAERFGSPQPIPSGGGSLTVNVTIPLGTC